MTAKILVVDDSPTVGSTVGWVLSNSGYEVHVAQDGLTALSVIHTLAPDLILLDVRLPHIDGLKLCAMLRHNAKYTSLPIVMLSGLSAPADVERAIAAGASNYIAKPIDDERLLEIVQQELDKAAEMTRSRATE